MSQLFMVRHAQASFGGPDYDRLSTLGEEQARRLGIYWAEQEMAFDRVYVGPRERHRRTAAIVRSVFSERGLAWPEPAALPEADEYDGLEVFRRAMPLLGVDDATIRKLAEPAMRSGPVEGGSLELLELFQGVMGQWVRGELDFPGVESWRDFRARARRGLQTMMAAGSGGQRIVVFTSTGPVAAAMDLAFELDDEHLMELSWQVRNTAVSEFLFSAPRFTLSMFNALPHLPEDELVTRI